MKLTIDNWRRTGVPFHIRTGKKLQQQAFKILIPLKNLAHYIFAKSGGDKFSDYLNRLVIRLQPSEGLRLHISSKQPGPGRMRLFPYDLNLSLEETFEERSQMRIKGC
jgi:glucose-6-phosphate 1-dehydrogenase